MTKGAMKLFFSWAILLMLATSGAIRSEVNPEVQLDTLNCGRLDFSNMAPFSDTGDYAGEAGVMVVPCYLVRHGKEWVLWDTGVGDRIALLPKGEMKLGAVYTLTQTLSTQLAELGLKPDDVHYVALSHLHSDHTGNVGLFPKATFLISSKELAWARETPTPVGVQSDLIAPLAHDTIKTSDDDVDVFGDGSIQLLKAPGHTPGHRMLLVKLARSGSILISGDLYHTRKDHEKGLVPSQNFDRASTLASFNRFAGIVNNTHARVVIQHSPEDFASMPTFPKYLD